MASVARRFYERQAVANALGTTLNTLGWNIGQVKKGYQPESDLEPPVVTLFFLPSSYVETQLGRGKTANKSFYRRVQVDCYMETEPRADTISDDVGDFFDEFFVEIKDPAGAVIGTIYCPDSETITLDSLPASFKDVEIKRWRGIVTASLQADYY
jgi:hypothetical protein